jgi:hypothetical protein
VSIALFAVVLTLYLRTLAPGALGGDPGELQFVPAILGMPHPTGTPLYVLLGKAWSLLPLGPTVAWRMNLLAAVSAALAVVVIYRCVYLYWARPVPAVAAALNLAIGITFWEQALLADKYAFNALMVSLILYLALRWGKTRSAATLNTLALVYGLSLAHHRSVVLFAPVLLAYVWWHEKGALWRDWRRLIRLAILGLAPLTLYLYLPWAEARGLPPGTWRPRGAGEWYDYFADTGFTGLVYVGPQDLVEQLRAYAGTLLRDYGVVGVVFGLAGLAVQFRRRWPDAAFLLANFLLQAVLAASYHVPRHWVFFIPSFLIYSLWVGEGLSAVWAAAEWAARGRRMAWVALSAVLALAMLAWVFLPFSGRYGPLRQAHHGAGVLDVWRQTLKQGHMAGRVGAAIADVAPDAVIVGDWEQATPLWYYQQVEGLRPDVQIVYPVERLDEAAAMGRPLYVARAHPGLAERWYPSSSDSLIALRADPSYDPPADLLPRNVPLALPGSGEPVLELSGVSYSKNGRTEEGPYYPSEVVPVTLYWRALDAPAHDYSVSLRLFSEAGEQVFAVDSQHPVLGTYPTSRWTTGEGVADYYEMQLPLDVPSGTYHWGAVVYRALPEGGWESLVTPERGELAVGGTFEVQQRGTR